MPTELNGVLTLIVSPNSRFVARFAAERSPGHLSDIIDAASFVRLNNVDLVVVDGREWDEKFIHLIEALDIVKCDVLWVTSPNTYDLFAAAHGVRLTWARPGWITPRMLDIIELVCEGETNEQIAQTLFMSEATVKTHLRAVFRNVPCASRAQLTHEAALHGWAR